MKETPERIRIRALVVARMNLFEEYRQEYLDLDKGDEDGAHVWAMAAGAMRGLLNEIDRGVSVRDLLDKRP